jgi:alkanesulfonate monooxygenase SsuD/methylene tetrahydromethanopterin reductase-like flavin-dependent oxidoreductase (luciferase family)
VSLMFGLRFDFRNPGMSGVSPAERYAAGLDMAEWSDRLGGLVITVSEHHLSPDCYLPSPLPMLAAMAARTTNVRFMVGALIAPFYDPLRLAEDMLVLDQLSRGRIDLIVAAGYVPEEFAAYGVSLQERAARVTETVHTLKGAFSGEPFEFRGRTVHLTPGPYRPGGPTVTWGGNSEAAARRAARIADGFLPSDPAVWTFYRDEMQKLGRPDPGPGLTDGHQTIVLSEDPERAWADIGPYFLYESNAYAAWLAGTDGAGPYRSYGDLEELRAVGMYRVLTPKDYVEELKAAPFPFALLHPMCGGLPPDLAWSSLRLFEAEVMPAFE